MSKTITVGNEQYRDAGSRGFTLIELLIAIAIAGLVLAVSVPATARFYQSVQYRAAVRDVIGLLASARYVAIKSGRAQDVKVNVPENQASSAWTIGEVADYYRITRDISRGLNGGAAWVLLVVHTVVQFPPTTVEGDTYTWGPWSNALEPAEWRLVVTDKSDGSYDWSLEGNSKLEEEVNFEAVISGNAIPGDEPHRGRRIRGRLCAEPQR